MKKFNLSLSALLLFLVMSPSFVFSQDDKETKETEAKKEEVKKEESKKVETKTETKSSKTSSKKTKSSKTSEKETKKEKDIKIKVYYVSSGQILESDNLRGYYEFLEIDESFNKEQNYQIKLYDENFTGLNNIKFKDKVNMKLMGCAYSSEELCFMFYNKEGKKFEYRTFDMEGKPVNKMEDELTKKQIKKLEKYGGFAKVRNLEGGGFLATSTVSEKSKMTFKVVKMLKGSNKLLTYQFQPVKKFNNPYILGVANNTIVLGINSLKRSNGRSSFGVLGLDQNTLKQKFYKNSQKDGENVFQPYSLIENPDYNTIKLGGAYYSVRGNTLKNTKGLAMWELDTAGTLLKEKYNSWGNDFEKFMPFNRYGKCKKFGFVKMHDMFSTIDGKTYAVGEGYRKMFNYPAFLTFLIGWPMYFSRFQTTDLAIFEFDKDFNFKQGKRIEKPKKGYTAYGFFTMSPHKISNFMPTFGFRYSQLDEEKKNFMLGYTTGKLWGNNRESAFNTCRYENGKYIFDKMPTQKNSVSSYMKNQYGKVAFYNFDYKKNESESRIVKVK